MDYSKLTNEQLNILLHQEQQTTESLKLSQEIIKRFEYYTERNEIPLYDTARETYKR